ncbi:MTAP family purine nucleoside phosphorylase [Candidatus Woesearchaeota archaeon]|nr:MTAP family purine nucleoside phosphorylase [Candidatus Woesearchaeota archaeon]
MTGNVSEVTKKNLVAIIGGSGINDMPMFKVQDDRWLTFDTKHKLTFPDGSKTSGVVHYKLDDEANPSVIFIPRHGIEGHRHGPSRTQYGANLITARRLGATVVIGISAVGSLDREYPVSSLVVPSDYDDQTGRDDNLFGIGFVVHAHPNPAFSPELREILLKTAGEKRYFEEVKPTGTYVCIPGDRFGTRAEGIRRLYHGKIVGMTICPEASMAMQLGLHYACAAIVVDNNFDANHEGGTLKVMEELSAPDKMPAYVTEAVKKACEYAKTAQSIPQLRGNIIPDDLNRIRNPHLRAIASDLVKVYCK